MSSVIANDSMRGLFFVIKGQYRRNLQPAFVNRATGETSYVGGYDPRSEETENWYQLVDRKCYHCVSCGSDLNKVLRCVKTMILKYKGSLRKYCEFVSRTTSDDYYETHYLGHKPLDTKGYTKKAEGRCPRTSPAMRCLQDAIDDYYGDFYSSQVERMEDEAYAELVDEKPVNKSRKIVQRARKSLGLAVPKVETPPPVPSTVGKPVLKRPAPVAEKKGDKPSMVIRPVKRKPVKLLKV